MKEYKIIEGNCIEGMKQIPDGTVQTCITSPPYWGLRDYGNGDQIGLEETPDAYVQKMVEVFREVRRVLRDDGTVWLNLGDSYMAAKNAVPPPACGRGERWLGRRCRDGRRSACHGGKHFAVLWGPHGPGAVIPRVSAHPPESMTREPFDANDQIVYRMIECG